MEGPLPFDYKPPVEPDELADMLVDQIKLGTYVLDQPEPLTAKRRTPAESFPDLGKQFWHIKNRSFPNLLGALLEDIPTAIEEATPAYGLMARAFSVAVTEDARAAAGFAEACLRLAPAEKLPEALERLAAAYCFAKEYDKLEALLAAGTEFRLPGRDNGVGLPAELAPVLAADAVGDDTDCFRALHLALLTGRRSSAVESLDRLSEESGRAAFEPLVRRLSEGLTVGLDEKARHRLDRRFDAMRRQLEAPRLPLHDRFADWPSERLEDHLRWCAATLGGHSDAAADILAYMVEQRDYRGLKVSSGTALCAGKRFCLRGEPARSLPMFLLVQKLGYLSEDGRFDEDGAEAMVSFNGFESSVYFAKAIIEHVDLRNFVKEHEDIYRVAMDMYTYSEAHCLDSRSAGIAGRYGYYEIALKFRWPLSLLTGHPDDAIPELKEMIRSGPTSGIRRKAAGCLGGHYLSGTKEYEKAASVFRRLAVGEVDGRCSRYGLDMLYRVAHTSGKQDFLKECIVAIDEMVQNSTDRTDTERFTTRLTEFRGRIQNELKEKGS